MPHRRGFISTVSHEFLTFRERRATDLRFPDVDVQTQEKNLASMPSGKTILLAISGDCAGKSRRFTGNVG